MKTINSEFIRDYDNFKQQIFHSKKQEIKNNLRSKTVKKDPIKIKKIFPWRTLTKLSALGGLLYLTYNYADQFLNHLIRTNYINVIDLKAVKTVKEDFLVKLKTLLTSPSEVKNLSHFSNYMFQDEMMKDLQYMNKIYPTHKLKGRLQTRLKIWIFRFNNYQKCQYVNQFGDLVEREEKSKIRIWRYPLLKNRKQTIIQEDKIHSYYRGIIEKSQSLDKGLVLGSQIIIKCQKINILNRFSSDYDSLIEQCRQNIKIGEQITKLIKQRKNRYHYPQASTKVE